MKNLQDLKEFEEKFTSIFDYGVIGYRFVGYNDDNHSPKFFKAKELEMFIIQDRQEVKDEILKEIDNLIAEEMLIANKEKTPTSRLTSLANKINNLDK